MSSLASSGRSLPYVYLDGIVLKRSWAGEVRNVSLLVARLRHIAGTAWSTKRYLNIELLKDQQMRGAITA